MLQINSAYSAPNIIETGRNITFAQSVSKNAPRCSFDKHGLILIIFSQRHGHTFKNDMRIQLSLSLHFYLHVLYLLLNSWDGNDAFWRHSMLVKQFSSFSRKHRTLSLQICVCQTVQNLWTDAGTCLYNVGLQWKPTCFFGRLLVGLKRAVFLGKLLVALKRAGCVVCWFWKEPVSV